MTLCQETNRGSEEYAWEHRPPTRKRYSHRLYRCKHNVNTFTN